MCKMRYHTCAMQSLLMLTGIIFMSSSLAVNMDINIVLLKENEDDKYCDVNDFLKYFYFHNKNMNNLLKN